MKKLRRSQRILLAILGGCLLAACCLASAIVRQSSKTAVSPDIMVSPSTATLTLTPMPTPTPTPRPTAPPFVDIRSRLKDVTSAQRNDYFQKLEGSVVEWAGWVSEVYKETSTGCKITVDMDPPDAVFSVSDVRFEIPADIALQFQRDQQIAFSGQIESIGTFLGALDIDLVEVTINPILTSTVTSEVTPSLEVTLISTLTPMPSLINATVKTEALNFRAGPGVEYAIIGQLQQGDVAAIIGQNPGGDWLKIEHEGKIGWVAKAYVEAPTEVVMVPVVEAPPTPTARPVPKATSISQLTPTPESGFGKWFYSGKAAVAATEINRHGELGIWEPSAGYIFVSVGIVYANGGDSGTVHCNPFNFKMMTGEGLIYNHSIATLEPSLKAVDLVPDARTKGWVTFEIPTDATSLTLLWEPTLFSKTVYIPLR